MSESVAELLAVKVFNSNGADCAVGTAELVLLFPRTVPAAILASAGVQVPEVEMLQVPVTAKPVPAVMVTFVNVPALPQAGVDAP